MNPEQIEALAAEFWERAGLTPGTPGDLEAAISLTVPVSVVRLAGLSPLAIGRWLLRQGIRLSLRVPERPLDGCLVAHRGHAVLFLRGGLEGRYERMILAHELGHWLAHYQRPRDRVTRRLGSSVRPVLDGERAPSAEEGWAGVLAGVALRPHEHYLERDFDPRHLVRTNRIEREATALACELLAPRHAVSARAAALGLTVEVGAWVRLLREEFAFPDAWACVHAVRLVHGRREGRRFTDFLGL